MAGFSAETGSRQLSLGLMDYLIKLTTLGYVAVAMGLGAVLGLERELADKPAGMRTHMLVGGAAALLVLLGDILVTRFGQEFSDGWIRADPIRIVEAIVTGVAFLGAGTIIRRGGQTAVQGLTTAASLLFTAAIGVSVALHEILIATGATLLALATLRVARFVETRMGSKSADSPHDSEARPPEDDPE